MLFTEVLFLQYFYNCTCVDGINPEDWQAKSGSCYTSCENLSLYLGIFFLVVLFNFMSSTPAMVATFRYEISCKG